jgi:glycosyltransferase involved in cell wall biosynthesis
VLVVTTNVGGIPYMVDHQKDAILVEPRQPELMFQAIDSLINHKEVAGKLAASGYEKVEAYQSHQVIPMLENIYQKAY